MDSQPQWISHKWQWIFYHDITKPTSVRNKLEYKRGAGVGLMVCKLRRLPKSNQTSSSKRRIFGRPSLTRSNKTPSWPCMFPTAFPIFATHWQVVKRKPWNISHVMRSTNLMQTSQLSWCYCETCDLSPDLTVSQPRPRFSWSTFPDHDRPSRTTGDFNPFCWTVIICCQKCGLKTCACRITTYTSQSPIMDQDLWVKILLHFALGD